MNIKKNIRKSKDIYKNVIDIFAHRCYINNIKKRNGTGTVLILLQIE